MSAGEAELENDYFSVLPEIMFQIFSSMSSHWQYAIPKIKGYVAYAVWKQG